jgi:hypothetical protein
VKEYELSPEEVEAIEELNALIKAYTMQREGALKMILKQHKLTGDYRFVGNKLVLYEPETQTKKANK